MQVLEGHGHGVKRQHHAARRLALAIPAKPHCARQVMPFVQGAYRA